MTEDIFVVFLDMDYGMHGTSCLNSDGSVTVFLNSRDSREQQVKAYRHEIDHIVKKDFEKSDVQDIEYEAHMEGR